MSRNNMPIERYVAVDQSGGFKSPVILNEPFVNLTLVKECILLQQQSVEIKKLQEENSKLQAENTNLEQKNVEKNMQLKRYASSNDKLKKELAEKDKQLKKADEPYNIIQTAPGIEFNIDDYKHLQSVKLIRHDDRDTKLQLYNLVSNGIKMNDLHRKDIMDMFVNMDKCVYYNNKHGNTALYQKLCSFNLKLYIDGIEEHNGWRIFAFKLLVLRIINDKANEFLDKYLYDQRTDINQQNISRDDAHHRLPRSGSPRRSPSRSSYKRQRTLNQYD